MSGAMAADGVYDAHSDYQLRGALAADELVGDLAANIEPRDGRGAVLADYGCAQGRVTNALLRTALQRFRARHQDTPVAVYHNDRLDNDWQALLERLRDPSSYLHLSGGPITPLISATSFYRPVTPPAVVDLGISFAAAQWLDDPGPAGTGTALYFDQLAPSDRDAMAAQAHDDWTRFLALRADELAPRGRLVVNLMCAPGGAVAGHDLWAIVREVCAALAEEGRIDPARLDGYVIGVYERSVDELRRPFAGDRAARLDLLDLSVDPVPNPIAERFRQDGDADAFARDLTGFFRAWSAPSLTAGLDLGPATVQQLYERVEARLRVAAPQVRFEVTTATVVAAPR
jgi:SAM-dependent methyltransferase